MNRPSRFQIIRQFIPRPEAKEISLLLPLRAEEKRIDSLGNLVEELDWIT